MLMLSGFVVMSHNFHITRCDLVHLSNAQRSYCLTLKVTNATCSKRLFSSTLKHNSSSGYFLMSQSVLKEIRPSQQAEPIYCVIQDDVSALLFLTVLVAIFIDQLLKPGLNM